MPNRILKESVCTSEKIAELSDFEYRLWTGLILMADDAGRGDARSAIIKGRVFPLRGRVTVKDIDVAIQRLADKGCISLYESDGKSYFYFPTWSKHQRVRNVQPKYPTPPENPVKNDDLRQSAANCRNLPQSAAICGELRPESNPIQSNIESESESNPVSHARAREDDAFSRFWAVYPKKVGKLAAQKSFAKVKAPVETLIAAVERQKQSSQWQKDGGQYIPNPATWLNQGRWEDDLEAAADAGGSRSYFYGKYKSMEDDE